MVMAKYFRHWLRTDFCTLKLLSSACTLNTPATTISWLLYFYASRWVARDPTLSRLGEYQAWTRLANIVKSSYALVIISGVPKVSPAGNRTSEMK